MVMPKPTPLEALLRDIEKALDSNLYYLALAVTLSLPDICVCLACEPNKIWTNQKKYEAWCDQNIVPHFQRLTARDCYRLRCGVVHQGNFGRPDNRYDRIIFHPRPARGHKVMHEFVSRAGTVEANEIALTLDLTTFCTIFIAAARSWMEKMDDDPNVAANAPNIVRFRSEGISPHVIGLPIIA